MPPETCILAFDTSAAHCAAALLCGDQILAAQYEAMAKGQAERLFPMLEELLRDGGKAWAELDLIGVGIGPGNFTGVRISVAAARGLALSLGIPAVGVSGLEAQVHGQTGMVVSTLDARQGTLYLQVFGQSAGPLICDLAHLPVLGPGGPPTCVGHEAEQIAAIYGGRTLAPHAPLAVAIARIAASRRLTPGPRPAPLYLRAADAAPARDRGPVILA